jgi:hypothetical protein
LTVATDEPAGATKSKKNGTDRASDKQEPEIMLTSLAVQPEDSTAVIRPLGSLEELFYLSQPG